LQGQRDRSASDGLQPAPRGAAVGAARAGAACLLALGLAALCGCASGRVNLWPFYFQETRLVETPQGRRPVRTVEVLYPFFSSESHADGGWHTLRPFYAYERNRPEDWSRVHYVWPLGLAYRQGDEVTHHRLFPFFEYLKNWSPRTGRHAVHCHVLQLIRWGSDDEWGPYFAVFPFGGVTHGVLADTWSFLVFPLYSYYRQGDYVRHDFPWPFVGRGATPDGSRRMFRIWPFYVQKAKDTPRELRYRYDVVWPILRWGGLDRGGAYYHTVLVVTPFYSSVKTWDREGNLVGALRGVLGVFLRTGDEEEARFGGWSALWSLLRSARGPGWDEFRFIPFYWRTTYYAAGTDDPEQAWTRYRVPWPLVWVDRDRRDADHHKGGFVLAPLLWRYTDTFRSEDGPDRKGSRTTLWPLLTWERQPDGGAHLWIVSRGWRDPSQAYKRVLRGLFEFFQFHHEPEGDTETRLVWRLYHHLRGPAGRYLSVAGLFTLDTRGEAVGEEQPYASALFGLVKCSWSAEGRRWRVFYIPLGGGASTESSDAEGR
jgi:hypothetical protein